MDKKKLLQTAGGMFAILSISRIIGFFREMLIAYRYGSGMETDAFFVASGVQHMVFAVFASGLTAAMIPIISEIRRDGSGLDEGRYVSAILNAFAIASVAVICLGYAFAEPIVRVFAVAFEGDQLRLAVLLTRISLPMVFLFMLSSVLIAYNHSLGSFVLPSIESIVFNVPVIAYLAFYYQSHGLVGLMASIVLGSLLRIAAAYIPLARVWKYSLALGSEKKNVLKTVQMMGPILAASLAGQVNHVVDKTLASRLAVGSISALEYAQRAKGVVISLFLASLVAVVYPKLSEYITEKRWAELQKTMTYSMNLVILVVVPALAGLAVLNQPIIKVLFFRGAFTQANVDMTSSALLFYSIGLAGSGVALLVDRVYFSLHDAATPMKVGIAAVAINIVLDLVLAGPMKHNGLALATSIAGTFAAAAKFLLLRKKDIAVEYRKMLKTFLKACLSAGAMGAAVYALALHAIEIPSGEAAWQIGKLLSVCASGALVYGLGLHLLGVEEVLEITRKIMDRAKKSMGW